MVTNSEVRPVQKVEDTSVVTPTPVKLDVANQPSPPPVVKNIDSNLDSDPIVTIDKNYFAVKGGPTLKISGVMKDGDNSSIIIGEEFLLIGEEIDGVVIEKVTRRKLMLSYKGKSYAVPI